MALLISSANNVNVQILVIGFKVFQINSALTLYVDGTNAILRVNQLEFTNASANTLKEVYTLPSEYQDYVPPTALLVNDYNVNRTVILGDNRKISIVQTTSGSGLINATFTYSYQ